MCIISIELFKIALVLTSEHCVDICVPHGAQNSHDFYTEVNGHVISAVISTLSLVGIAVLLKTRGASAIW
jgi:hypothetical protein